MRMVGTILCLKKVVCEWYMCMWMIRALFIHLKENLLDSHHTYKNHLHWSSQAKIGESEARISISS